MTHVGSMWLVLFVCNQISPDQMWDQHDRSCYGLHNNVIQIKLYKSNGGLGWPAHPPPATNNPPQPSLLCVCVVCPILVGLCPTVYSPSCWHAPFMWSPRFATLLLGGQVGWGCMHEEERDIII